MCVCVCFIYSELVGRTQPRRSVNNRRFVTRFVVLDGGRALAGRCKYVRAAAAEKD